MLGAVLRVLFFFFVIVFSPTSLALLGCRSTHLGSHRVIGCFFPLFSSPCLIPAFPWQWEAPSLYGTNVRAAKDKKGEKQQQKVHLLS